MAERLFTFKSGGWALVVGIVLAVIGTAYNLAPLWSPDRPKVRGDGRNPATYGFDLSTALVAREAIVSSGMVVDTLRPIDKPEFITPNRVRAMEAVERGKYLVPSDKVIGVEIGGEARAYPLRVLAWHEIVNDVVGGVPIVVTYHPLSEGIAVLERGVDGETLEFAHSGLLFNSTLLLYDRRAGSRGESLWSPLQGRAVAGPAAAAGKTLRRVPCALARWEDWTERYPSTVVLGPLLDEVDRYGRDVYGTYFNSDEIKYPVTPMPPPDSPFPAKARVAIVWGPGEERPRVQAQRRVMSEQRPAWLGPTVEPLPAVYAFWFAWYATHPDDPGMLVRE